MPWSWLDPAHATAHKKKRNPCGSNKPETPTNVSGLYQREEGTKDNIFRLKVTWDPVFYTQAGEEYKPDAYGIQLWGSKDGTTWQRQNIRHEQVRGTAGPDGDWGTADDTKVPTWVLFYNIKPKWHYQVRVRALSKTECDGSFSDWVPMGTANDNVPPPPPTMVKIWENSTAKRVVLDWEPPPDPSDAELVDQGVTFFQIQLSKNQNFSSIYRFDKMQATSTRSFRIDDADISANFYGRVRSIDAAGNKSAWIPATHNGNSNPNATPEAAGVGGSGGSTVVAFSVSGVVRAPKLYTTAWTAPDNLKIVKVFARVGVHDADIHPEDGCPRMNDGGTDGSIYIQLRKYAADESDFTKVFLADNKLEIAPDTHKASAELVDSEIDHPDVDAGEHLVLRVSKGEDNFFTGRGLVVRVKMEPR